MFLVTLLPALLLGPVAGAIADRFDRRMTMIIGDVIRGLLFLSIPLFPNLTWIYVAKFLAEGSPRSSGPRRPTRPCPTWCPRRSWSGPTNSAWSPPTAARRWPLAWFSVMALIIHGLSLVTPFFHTQNNNTYAYLALYFNAVSYFVSALTVYFLREISNRRERGEISVPSTAKAIWDGWLFIRHTPVVRGLVIGMLGAFSAAGVVIGLGYSYIHDTLGGGNAGWAWCSPRSSSGWPSAWASGRGCSAASPGGGCSG